MKSSIVIVGLNPPVGAGAAAGVVETEVEGEVEGEFEGEAGGVGVWLIGSNGRG